MSMDVMAAGAASVHAMSGASYGGPPPQKMANLFDAIDTSGAGAISKAQFEQAFATKKPPSVFKQQGADAIFAALDPAGTGSVSKKDFIAGMTKLMVSLRAPPAAQPATPPANTLATSLQDLNGLGGGDHSPGSVVNLQA